MSQDMPNSAEAPSNSPQGTRGPLQCHPGRRHYARGLCQPCYWAEWDKKNPRLKQLTLPAEPPVNLVQRTAVLEHFHVRSHMPVDEALAGERVAAGWTARVLRFFENYQGTRFTPSEVRRRLRESNGLGELGCPPLTSFRRSISDLTRAGKLVHHPQDRRPGMFGPRSKESTWELA